MSNDRSPDTPVSADPASWADGDDGDGRDLPQSRGLFGRLFGAFGGGDDAEPDTGAARAALSAASGAPGIINLRRMRVDDVAVPKAEIVAAPVSIDLDSLVAMFREHGFSRIPVFRDNLDSPLGMIHLKDLALKYGFDADTPSEFALRPMLRPVLYVPPSMSIGVLLQQMQQKRIHMALVIDEYGGVDGLLTIEDLIEQVIGEIEDEHDEIDGSHILLEKPGQWLIEARAGVDEVEAETGLRLAPEDDDDEIETLGGLIFSLTGRVPVRGEIIPLDNGAEFEIIDADPRRIERVRLRLPQPGAETATSDV